MFGGTHLHGRRPQTFLSRPHSIQKHACGPQFADPCFRTRRIFVEILQIRVFCLVISTTKQSYSIEENHKFNNFFHDLN